MGVLDPNQTVQRPDSEGNLHHLLARDRWTQKPLTRNAYNDDDNNVSLDLWYNLNGEKRPWDVQQNDELWNALQPALQLVSKVLLAEHPFWKAVLSIYHMRPVPVEKDGRTQLQKADPTYKPYVSIWYDIDRDKMYPTARTLMDQKFDSTAATLEILTRLLKFSIARSDSRTSSASTRIGGFEPHNRSIRIVLNANNIWPLLVPDYSVSEKISVSFFVAKLILHELAHAARNALDYIVIFPDILEDPPWTPPPGTAFNQNIRDDIRSFCSEALKLPPLEVFFQDVPQLEEGKSFENQLFGFDTVSAPNPGQGRHNDSIRPALSAVAWPWKHPAIHLQNQKSVDAGLYDNYTSDGYKTYLLDPPVSAYDLYTPLPVSSYAKFMQQSWWNMDFVKFGHQALKIPIHSTDPSSPFKTAARPTDSFADFVPLLTSVIRSRVALSFIVNYAMPRLHEHRQISILNYLALLTREAAAANIMRNRLHYEKRTWPNRFHRIRDLGEKSTESFNTVWDVLIKVLQRPLSLNTLNDLDEVIMSIRELLANLTELNRLLGIEVQYAQALAAQYMLKTPEARRKIHRRYMRFLRENMVRIRDYVARVVETITPSHEEDGRLVWKTITAPWEARFDYMLETNPVALDALEESEANTINDNIFGLANIRKYTQQTCADLLSTSSHMENVLPILGDQYIDFPIASAPTGLFPGVPIAMQMMELSKIIEKRAIYDIMRLKNEGLDKIVRQWVEILHTHAGSSARLAAVGETIHRARTKAEIKAVAIVLFQAKRREVQPAGPTYDGRHPRDLLVASTRGQLMLMIGDDEGLRLWLRHKRSNCGLVALVRPNQLRRIYLHVAFLCVPSRFRADTAVIIWRQINSGSLG
ncbi:hypothetical protein FJTKL_08644 [Diaporthe vaccinii]|uniref:Uncharacterized protein n=1 Tax=Diaporthe vaccinii TaxID=105482 RepID=A0ABR4ER65_9PEZI